MPLLLNAIYPALFFLFGPFMALYSRGVYLWAALVTLCFIPLFIRFFKEIRHALCLRNLSLLLGAIAFTFASVLWSLSPRALEMAVGLTAMIICGGILFLAMPHLTDTQKNRLGFGFALGWIVGLAFVVFDVFNNQMLHRMLNNLNPTEFINENVMKRKAALFSLSIWPFALFMHQRFGKRAAILSVIIFFVISAFLTSRSALLGVTLGMGVLFFAFAYAALARWVLMAIISFGIVFTPPLFTLLPLAPPEITGRFFDSAQHRMKIWTLTAQHVIAAPIFGNGIDASRGITSHVQKEAASYLPEGNAVISLHPHNLFLQIWLDGGLLGALLWGGLLLLLADRMRYLPTHAQPYALATSYAALAMLSTTYSILQTWWMAGHIGVAALILLLAYNTLRKADTNGTSAGGIG